MKIDEMIKQYRELRDKKAAIAKLCDEKTKPLTEAMLELNAQILSFLNQTGQESAKSKYGTAFKKEKLMLSITDADAFFEFITKNDAYDLLTKQVIKSAYKDYEDNGVVVPGVKAQRQQVINIRKA